ncbi:MAG: response regulator [Planctomyces sp.]|nr:response regulator [Planctomyces sp.]
METAALHVLVIEDEQPIRRFLRASLTDAGYRVSEATSGTEGLRTAASQPPDLIVLDLGLPDIDGQEIIQRLREWYSAPIIVLSARDQEAQKVLALDHGADDYIAKPFGVGELLARLRVATRHANSLITDNQIVRIGELEIEISARRIRIRGSEVHLTPIEYKLLLTMVKHAGKVLTHRYLLREVWGPQDSQENHYLRVFVAGLRRKLEIDPARPRYILTEQGVGYRFASE